MKVSNLEQLRQAAAIVQPYVNKMCNSTDIASVNECLEVIKHTVSAIYMYKAQELGDTSVEKTE